MESTAEQKAAFGKALREARKAAGLSGPAVCRALGEAGFPTDHQAFYQWEKGATAPAQRAVLDELERIVNATGRLAALLLGPSDVEQRLRSLEDRFERIEQRLEGLLRRRR